MVELGVGVWMGVGCSCRPVHNNIVWRKVKKTKPAEFLGFLFSHEAFGEVNLHQANDTNRVSNKFGKNIIVHKPYFEAT